MQKYFSKFRKTKRHLSTSTHDYQLSRIRWCHLVFAAALVCSTILPVGTAEAKTCDDVRFIFARGSGEEIGDASYRAWQSEITKQLTGTTLKYSFYELGSTAQSGYQYPAVSVSDDFWGIMNLFGALISAGQSYAFGDSVHQGEIELNVYIRSVNLSCPNTKFVLGGYSQGAMVLSQTLDNLVSDNILYVATFGDPKLYLPEGKGGAGRLSKIPDACQGKNLSPYRIDVADCWAYEGVLGSVRPYQPVEYNGKIGAWCNSFDIMCSSGMSLSDHTSYISENMYADAAYEILQKLRQEFPEHFATEETKFGALHDVVFLFDMTESMGAGFSKYINEAKNLAMQVLEAGGRVSLFTYGDLKDNILPTQRCDLSCSFEEFNKQVDAIRLKGGDDAPESLLSGLMAAMNQSFWRRNATKSIVVLTDAGYHDPDLDDDQTTLDDVVRRSLEIDPVNIYVVTTSNMQKTYKTLAERTGGKIFNYNSNIALSTDYIIERPVAKLSLESYVGVLNEEIRFDASDSYALDGSALTFDWDLDGDGEFELLNSPSIISQTYSQEFSGYIQVRISSGDRSSTMSAKVVITDKLPSRSEVFSLTDTEVGGVVTVDFTTDADQVLIVLGDMPIGFVAPQGSTGNFKISGIEEDVELTLVPFSEQVRGVSKTITLQKSNSPVQDPPVQNPTPQDPPAQDLPVQTPTTSPSPSIPKVPSVSIPVSKDESENSVPSAPNTGSITY